jgi:hypothetical protein
MESYPGLYPAIVRDYHADSRLCGVEIPGLTDGADEFLQAEINYPIGDKSWTGDYSTEIEILPGDKVNVMFLAGDSRKPIIMGYRCPQTGNSTGTRRYHHAAIELIADSALRLVVGGVTIELTPSGVAGDGGGLTWRGKVIDDTHTHGGVQTGSGNTAPPN